MEYFLSFLFLALHLVDYEYNIPNILFLVVSTALFLALYHVCYKKTGDFLCSSIMMFCHVWQASWINIFGDWASEMPITWFYIIGVIILVYCLLNIKKMMTNEVGAIPLALFVSFMILMPYPLIISPSLSMGLNEYLIIAFFTVIAFAAFIFRGSISSEKRKYVVRSYLFCILVSCFFLLVQYSVYKFSGRALFNYSVGVYYGNQNASSNLLMGDTSCSTIMIGAASFFLLELLNKKNWYYCIILSALLMAGIGVTTRRTSIVSLAIVLVFYVLLHYKGVMKRLYMAIVVAGIMSVMLMYLYFARSINSLSLLLDSNGRFEGYLEAIKLLRKNPFGVGYDNNHLRYLVGGIVPHNSMLRWADMGGILFAILIGLLLLYFISVAYKRKCKTEFWFLLYAVFASNFIPDILNARLLIVPVMMVFLFKDEEESTLEKESAVIQSRNQLQSRL